MPGAIILRQAAAGHTESPSTMSH